MPFVNVGRNEVILSLMSLYAISAAKNDVIKQLQLTLRLSNRWSPEQRFKKYNKHYLA